MKSASFLPLLPAFAGTSFAGVNCGRNPFGLFKAKCNG